MTESREIFDAQPAVHERLADIIAKHLDCPYLKPIQAHNLAAFEQFQQWLTQKQTPNQPKGLWLDSCCGTGFSTVQIARANPGRLVVGIDQSLKRLSKEADYLQNSPSNCLFLRTNCEDFWRLCVDANIRFEHHTIYYPNPYPKPAQITKRWHGHPVFPVLKALSADIEVRSNWPVYIEEFAAAWQQLTEQCLIVSELLIDRPVTLFEKKYAAGGQRLWGATKKSFFQPLSDAAE